MKKHTFFYSLLRKNPSRDPPRENRLLPRWWSRLIVDEKTRCVSFSVACQEWWSGEGEERESGRRRAKETVYPRGTNRSCQRKERKCVLYSPRPSKRPYTRLFSFHRASLTSVVRRIDSLSFSLSLSRLSFLLLLPSPPPLLSRDVCEVIHWKITDKKFRIIKVCKNASNNIYSFYSIIITFRR